MSAEKKTTPSWLAWAQLVRLPAVFTIIADVLAAFLLVAHGPEPVIRLAAVLIAGVSFYWAGMILNDVFDIDQDQKERPERPLPSGTIPVSTASRAGWGLLAVGVVAGSASGYLPDSDFAATWLPAAVSVALAVMIVAYDGPLKSTLLAPAAMGSCRFLSFLLGASPCLIAFADGGPLFPKYLLAIALGFGVYVMGLTSMAKYEAVGGPSANLNTGLLLTIIGAVILAFAPQTAPRNLGWRFVPDSVFPILIGLITFPIVLRGLRLLQDPSPAMIQNTIRAGVLTIIPLAASFALLGAGRFWGLAVFLLVVPAILTAIRMRVT